MAAALRRRLGLAAGEAPGEAAVAVTFRFGEGEVFYMISH